jgi:hypothetical protein
VLGRKVTVAEEVTRDGTDVSSASELPEVELIVDKLALGISEGGPLIVSPMVLRGGNILRVVWRRLGGRLQH